MHVEVFDQDDELVCSFDRTVLSLKRPTDEDEHEAEPGDGDGGGDEDEDD
jgi:hypothetical protein